ncbi:UPF0102 protein Bpet0439 [Bordetella sputigena]|uniref:YraN family protein n=1 Tax=Bordetella sputigena TaxID=1416810 RepID=UPI0039F12555
MSDDHTEPRFESARRAQGLRLRRRRREQARNVDRNHDAIAITWIDDGAPDESDASGISGMSGGMAGRLSPTQHIGGDYEDQALALLRRAGLQPLARNLRCRAGEIDLALRDGNTLVLVEVRARGDGRYGGAAASVGPDKQARLVRAAWTLLPTLATRGWSGRQPAVRFDVIAFEGETPLWLRHAFDVAMR